MNQESKGPLIQDVRLNLRVYDVDVAYIFIRPKASRVDIFPRVWRLVGYVLMAHFILCQEMLTAPSDNFSAIDIKPLPSFARKPKPLGRPAQNMSSWKFCNVLHESDKEFVTTCDGCSDRNDLKLTIKT